MSGDLWSDIGWVCLAGAAGCLLWAVTGFVLAHLLGRNNIVDTIWGLGFVLVAAFAVVVSVGLGNGDPLRRTLLMLTVLVWGVRLAWHVGRRGAGKGEDPRYADLLGKGHGSATVRAVLLIFAPQALALFVVSLPVQLGVVERGPVGVLGWLGVAVWAVGLCFEAVGDAQMSRYKADPDNKGKIADIGLWSYTRHPNYFGDAMVWWGVWIIAAERWPGVLSVIGPVLMTGLLVFGTGKRLLEKSMKDRPGYRDYMRRTSGFVPLPHSVQRRLTGSRAG
ncbi:MAG: DUF1295 domain-containing protein [Marmoricola sp.]